MNVGTGKPTEAERGGVPHHLFDVADPWEQFDAARYRALADEKLREIAARGRPAFIVGGTGLWIRALLKGLVDAPGRDVAIRARLEEEAERLGLAALHDRLKVVDPESATKIRPSDPVRIIRALEVHEVGGVPLSRLHEEHRARPPRYEALQLAVEPPRDVLEERIRVRARAMFEGGILDETRALLADPRTRARLELVMGYREALRHLEGGLSLEEAISLTAIAQRQYSKRQRNWFKGEPEWRWLNAESPFDEAVAACEIAAHAD